MSGEHVRDLSEEDILLFGEIDLALEEVLRSLDEVLETLDIEPIDRSLIIYHMRLAYITGRKDQKDQYRL